MTTRRLIALGAAALLAACASRPARVVLPAPPTSSGTAAARPAPLAAEEKWLHEWFGGTPVEIHAEDDGALRVAVPVKHAFDAGQSRVKAPLGAVLDKVATSLRRQPGARLEVAAPADTAGSRSASVRDYLVSKGIRPARVGRGDAVASMVELRLVPGPQAVERLEDQPQVTGSGTRAVPPRSNQLKRPAAPAP